MTLPAANQYELKLVNLLLDTLQHRNASCIVTQNNPDPDAIASSAALAYLAQKKFGFTLPIYYSGIIGRAENVAMVKSLRNIATFAALPEFQKPVSVVLVDVQPGNNLVTLPALVKVAAIIDQHNLLRTVAAPFTDIRPALGATSTILNEYLRVARVEPPAELTTALYYGIKTNTMSLGRGASLMDVEAYFYLQPRIDVASLAEIENVSLPESYFNTLNRVLETTQIFGPLIANFIPNMLYPDLTGEVAEFLMRYQDCEYALSAGTFHDELYFSIRCRTAKPRADLLARSLTAKQGSGGGRSQSSGGKMMLSHTDARAVYNELLQKTLVFLNLPDDLPGHPLV